MQINKLIKVVAIATPLIGSFEGLRQYAYLDPVGIPTICFGETKGVKIGDYKSPDQCKEMLSERVEQFAIELNKCIDEGIPDKSYAAFLSLAYNVGVPKVCKSSIPVKLLEGRNIEACNTIRSFKNPPLPGIIKRRNEEANLCSNGFIEND